VTPPLAGAGADGPEGSLVINIMARAKEIQARLELRYRCPSCPEHRRRSRDILGEGECFWYTNWRKGNYRIVSYRWYRLLRRLGIRSSPFLD
jgi:ribosomal protein L37AE/L43A